MNRCPHPTISRFLRQTRPLGLTLVLLGGALGGLPAAAQLNDPNQVQTQNEAALGGRNFPVGTLRGKIVFGAFPEMQLDGNAERLAPGARIRNTQNMLVRPATLAGQHLAVNYRRDPSGLVHDVWILSPEEAGAKRVSANGTPLLNFWPFVSRAENE